MKEYLCCYSREYKLIGVYDMNDNEHTPEETPKKVYWMVRVMADGPQAAVENVHEVDSRYPLPPMNILTPGTIDILSAK